MAKRNYQVITSILVVIMLSTVSSPAVSQYYYKDLVSTQQINQTFRLYKSNKINLVKLNSFQGHLPVTEGFVCEQKINLAKNQVITYTKTADVGESFFTAFYNQQGFIVKTIDSTTESVGTSVYNYDGNNRLFELKHETYATDNSSKSTEDHLWQYGETGKPEKMLRIKNGIDTTTVMFKLDEKGNVVEEETIGKSLAKAKIYYYYDSKDRLTDVVRYNPKGKLLLPDYIFEYEEDGELSTMTLVPEGSSDYQKWYYKYDDSGLKVVEFCYNKRNELLGKIEYDYTASR